MIAPILGAVSAVATLAAEVLRAVRRGGRRRDSHKVPHKDPHKVAPFCPACDDDPAERCGVCGRRRSWVEA